MAKYRVKEGVHFEGGREYTKGKIVTSEKELDKLFPNKFDPISPAVVEDEDEEFLTERKAAKVPVPVTKPASKHSTK